MTHLYVWLQYISHVLFWFRSQNWEFPKITQWWGNGVLVYKGVLQFRNQIFSEQIFLFSYCCKRREQFVFCLFCWDVCISFLTAASLNLGNFLSFKKKIMQSTTESRPNKRAKGRKNGFCRKQNFWNSLCMKVHRPRHHPPAAQIQEKCKIS